MVKILILADIADTFHLGVVTLHNVRFFILHTQNKLSYPKCVLGTPSDLTCPPVHVS